MKGYRRSLWSYSLFQVPAMALGVCLVMALLFALLGWGRPQVSVAIALDLSGSTYDNNPSAFNTPDTIVYQEIEAVSAYLQRNSELSQPNQVKVLGFGNQVLPLTDRFQGDQEAVMEELESTLEENDFPSAIAPQGTNITLAIEEGVKAFTNISQGCRELLLVTDGEASVSSEVIKSAISNNVRINAIIIGGEAPALLAATTASGGIYFSERVGNLETLFIRDFFNRINSNLKWIIFWLSLGWVALAWMLVMPIDRWLLQGLFNLPFNLAGKLALSQALFWTTATVFFIIRLLGWGFNFIPSC